MAEGHIDTESRLCCTPGELCFILIVNGSLAAILMLPRSSALHIKSPVSHRGRGGKKQNRQLCLHLLISSTALRAVIASNGASSKILMCVITVNSDTAAVHSVSSKREKHIQVVAWLTVNLGVAQTS